jgi:hypothetical protein
MKKSYLALALLLAIPTAYGGDGILSRYGASGPISQRYGGSGPISTRYANTAPLEEDSQQRNRIEIQEQGQTISFKAQRRREQRWQQKKERPAAVLANGDTIVPSGEGYINTRDGSYYPPVGGGAVVNPENGEVIQIR